MKYKQSTDKNEYFNFRVAKQRVFPISFTHLPWRNGNSEKQFLDLMKCSLGGAKVEIVPLGRARTGIYLLTQFALQTGRTKVLLSPYTIPDVVRMVILAGGTPVFYDFEPGSTACDIGKLEAQIGYDTACVFITHYHVNEPQTETIRLLCKARGIYLFDDCALAFGGQIKGTSVGTLTDASVFSFSAFKTMNYFWGGAISTCDAKIARFVNDEVRDWPRLRGTDYIKQASNYLKYDLLSSPPIFDFITFPVMRRRALRSADTRGLQNVRSESDCLLPSLISRPSVSALREWKNKIPHVPAIIDHRRSIAAIYRKFLGEHMVSSRSASDVFNESCFMNFPVWVKSDARGRIYREMMAAGFDIGINLYPNNHNSAEFSTIEGNSHNIQKLIESSIYLPTHFGVNAAYAEKIAHKINQFI